MNKARQGLLNQESFWLPTAPTRLRKVFHSTEVAALSINNASALAVASTSIKTSYRESTRQDHEGLSLGSRRQVWESLLSKLRGEIRPRGRGIK